MGKMQFNEVAFFNVVWPKEKDAASRFNCHVRNEFLTKSDGSFFEGQDLYDILRAWLMDEFEACPIEFEYLVYE
jgi:hypothetical protein